jgi:hypothetical protein
MLHCLRDIKKTQKLCDSVGSKVLTAQPNFFEKPNDFHMIPFTNREEFVAFN